MHGAKVARSFPARRRLMDDAGRTAHRADFRCLMTTMKNLTIGKRLSLGLGGIILITLCLSV